MLIKLEIPAQASDWGIVCDRTLTLPVVAYDETAGHVHWYLNLVSLPMDEAIEDDGTSICAYLEGSQLIMSWTQDGVSCGETLILSSVMEVADYPIPF
jgi:hypothetical protein